MTLGLAADPVPAAAGVAARRGRRRCGRGRPAPGPTPTRSRRRSPTSRSGEAVLVEFGRRQALGVVLGEARPPPAGVVAEADHRAGPRRRPAAAAARARARALDRRATTSRRRRSCCGRCCRRGCSSGSSSSPSWRPAATDARRRPRRRRSRPRSTSSSAARDRPATSPRRRAGPGSSGGCGRSRRAAVISLDWTLLAASAGPRYERWVRLTPDGRRGRRASWPRGDRPERPTARAAPGAASPSCAELAGRRPATGCRGGADLGAPARDVGRRRARPARARRGRGPRAAAPPPRRSSRPGGAAAVRRRRTCLPAQAEALARHRDVDGARATRRRCSSKA